MKLSKTLSLAVGIMSCLFLPAIAQKQTVSPFAKGCSLMQHKDFQAAISSFSEAIADDVNDVNAYFRRGQSFFCLGNYSEAVRDFNHAAVKGAMDPNLYIWTGTAYASVGDDTNAILNYEKAMRLNPKLAGQPSAANNDQTLLETKSESTTGVKSAPFTGAKDDATKQAKLDLSTDAKADATKGAKPEPSSAVKAFATTVVKAESRPDGCSGQKLPHTISVGSSRNAVADYQTAAKNVLANVTGTFVPGILYSGIRNQSGALVELGVLDVGDSMTTSNRDKITEANLRASLRKLDDSINAQPQDAKLYFRRARVYFLLNKSTDGLADLTRAIDLDKTNPHYYLARAFYHYQHDETKDADADIREAQELNPIIPGELTYELTEKQKDKKQL